MIINKLFLMSFLFSLLISCEVKEHFYSFENGYYIDYGNNDSGLELYSPDSLKSPMFGISGDIVTFYHNKRYVVLKRHPKYIIDSLIRVYGHYNRLNYTDYFIVDMILGKPYGPFQKKEYLIKMQELNIPDSLRVDK